MLYLKIGNAQHRSMDVSKSKWRRFFKISKPRALLMLQMGLLFAALIFTMHGLVDRHASRRRLPSPSGAKTKQQMEEVTSDRPEAGSMNEEEPNLLGQQSGDTNKKESGVEGAKGGSKSDAEGAQMDDEPKPVEKDEEPKPVEKDEEPKPVLTSHRIRKQNKMGTWNTETTIVSRESGYYDFAAGNWETYTKYIGGANIKNFKLHSYGFCVANVKGLFKKTETWVCLVMLPTKPKFKVQPRFIGMMQLKRNPVEHLLMIQQFPDGSIDITADEIASTSKLGTEESKFLKHLLNEHPDKLKYFTLMSRSGWGKDHYKNDVAPIMPTKEFLKYILTTDDYGRNAYKGCFFTLPKVPDVNEIIEETEVADEE